MSHRPTESQNTSDPKSERDILISENRIGVFTVTRELIEQSASNLLKVLADVLVVDVEPACVSWRKNILCFKAYSPRFDPVVEGSVIPEYTFIVEEVAKDAWTHRVERVQQEGGSA